MNFLTNLFLNLLTNNYLYLLQFRCSPRSIAVIIIAGNREKIGTPAGNGDCNLLSRLPLRSCVFHLKCVQQRIKIGRIINKATRNYVSRVCHADRPIFIFCPGSKWLEKFMPSSWAFPLRAQVSCVLLITFLPDNN